MPFLGGERGNAVVDGVHHAADGRAPVQEGRGAAHDLDAVDREGFDGDAVVGTRSGRIEHGGAVLEDPDPFPVEATDDGPARVGSEVAGTDSGLVREGLAERRLEAEAQLRSLEDIGRTHHVEQRAAEGVAGDDDRRRLHRTAAAGTGRLLGLDSHGQRDENGETEAGQHLHGGIPGLGKHASGGDTGWEVKHCCDEGRKSRPDRGRLSSVRSHPWARRAAAPGTPPPRPVADRPAQNSAARAGPSCGVSSQWVSRRRTPSHTRRLMLALSTVKVRGASRAIPVAIR
jgi:hypothetical protein